MTSTPIALDTIACDDFRPHLGTEFEIVSLPDGTLAMTLVEASKSGLRAFRSGGRKPFSLIFRAPADRWPAQGTHRLSHPVMGALDLFLVPIGPDEGGMRIEAVFT